jgi:general secretion pathway protein L
MQYMMQWINRVAEAFSRWIDCVAGGMMGVRSRLISARVVRLVENADGAFTLFSAGASAAQTGRVRVVNGKLTGLPAETAESQLRSSHVELVLQPGRFIFRPLELPRRAGEFLEGIVRAQIDRLTPWSAQDAAFGYSKPTDLGNDRLTVTVAATARDLIAPLLNALAGFGADHIAVSTVAESGDGAAAIKVLEQKGGDELQVRRLRRRLAMIIVGAGLLATAALAAETIIGGSLQARQDEVVNRIAAHRATLRARLDSGSDAELAGLERRKHETPSSVIVLEALSRIFPDHTYVTELRLIGDKVQVVGVTRDAPSLIRLIEQSAYFTRATFFAPTTRSSSQSGDNFHIEAQIQPVYAPPT